MQFAVFTVMMPEYDRGSRVPAPGGWLSGVEWRVTHRAVTPGLPVLAEQPLHHRHRHRRRQAADWRAHARRRPGGPAWYLHADDGARRHRARHARRARAGVPAYPRFAAAL